MAHRLFCSSHLDFGRLLLLDLLRFGFVDYFVLGNSGVGVEFLDFPHVLIDRGEALLLEDSGGEVE